MNKVILSAVILSLGLPLVIHATETSSTAMPQNTIEYINKLNCDTFTGESENYCLQKKKEAAQTMRTGTGTEMKKPPQSGSGNVNTPPKRENGTGSIKKRPTQYATGNVLPPKPQNGTGGIMNQEGISAGIAKLSEKDRAELMKMIQKFLESKGIKTTLPPTTKPITNTVPKKVEPKDVKKTSPTTTKTTTTIRK